MPGVYMKAMTRRGRHGGAVPNGPVPLPAWLFPAFTVCTWPRQPACGRRLLPISGGQPHWQIWTHQFLWGMRRSPAGELKYAAVWWQAKISGFTLLMNVSIHRHRGVSGIMTTALSGRVLYLQPP